MSVHSLERQRQRATSTLNQGRPTPLARFLGDLLLATVCIAATPLLAHSSEANAPSTWVSLLQNELSVIERESSGVIGLFVKRLDDDATFRHHADQKWYLASTVKVPIAIAILQRYESGELSLDKKVSLTKNDFVDGAGDLLSQRPGTVVSVRDLIEKMLVQSDSTAADVLIRMIGVERLNQQVQKMIPEGFGRITTILQVRYDAYSELHPKARSLTNWDFIELKRSKGHERLLSFARKIGLLPKELKTKSIEDAFEKYYQRGLNSATLDAFGTLLEQLREGVLLKPENRDLLLGLMEKMKTGEKRLKAGFPLGFRFAQKTGTQVGRICNVGIVNATKRDLVIAACMEKFSNTVEAENTLAKVGRALVRSGAFH